jgi:hypothetical protein
MPLQTLDAQSQLLTHLICWDYPSAEYADGLYCKIARTDENIVLMFEAFSVPSTCVLTQTLSASVGDCTPQATNAS